MTDILHPVRGRARQRRKITLLVAVNILANGTQQAAAATPAACASLETRQSRFLKASQWRLLSNELLVSRGATERHRSAIHGSKTQSDLRSFLCKCATLTCCDFFPCRNIWCLCVVELLPSCLKSYRSYIPQFGLCACFYFFGASLCSSRNTKASEAHAGTNS